MKLTKKEHSMNHLSTIQREFVKEAAQWNELSQKAQKEYLKDHPKSKRRVTAKPKQDTSKLKSKLKEKQQSLDLPKDFDDVINHLDATINDDIEDELIINKEYATTLINDIAKGEDSSADQTVVDKIKSLSPEQQKTLVKRIVSIGKEQQNDE
jgi:transketolase